MLIEKESDLKVLEAIKTLLLKSELNPSLKGKLSSRALNAEDDIKSGNTFTRNEIDLKLNNLLGK
ncbi:hypothetical protein CLV48_10860 [Cecembia rubra]|uniref:Uncharacterized protein n=2 Tax=Cecembia rubra TaxID=1485585 RepID=A0A2P8E0E8_9BACT|nr:hypothetical protein CLV48_10860 [Cecembia rubra]